MQDPIGDTKRNFELFLNVVDKLRNEPSFENMNKTIAELCSYIGLDGFTWFFLDDKGEIIELDTRPTEWKQRYNDGIFIYKDPIVQTAATVNSPFIWDRALTVRKLTSSEWSVMNQSRDYGITDGFNFPVHDITPHKGSLSFYSDDLDLVYDVWAEHRNLLSYVSFTCHQISKGIISPSVEEAHQKRVLSEGEAAVLTLAAQGKRRSEIADILVISESTVKWRAKEAFKKLGVRTLPQATAKAALTNEINPFNMGVSDTKQYTI